MKTHRHLLPVLCSLLGLCMGFAATEAAQAQNAPVNETDSLALVALYNATGGPSWVHNDRWLTGRASTWEGVGTELRGEVRRVTRLTFLNNNLVGELPEDLKDLDALKSLALTGNMLSGPIPAYLGELTGLTFLSLNGNEFAGPIPDLGTLINLTTLFLQDNQLTGSIPPELGKMKSLQNLYLAENQLTGSIPQELDGLLNLKHLRLQTNKLMGAVPEFKNLPSLESLFLDINQLEDLPKLTELPASAALSVEDNRLTYEDLEPNVGHFASFNYLRQDSVETQVDLTGTLLSVEVGGTQTTYQWYKDGVPIPSQDGQATDKTYTVTENGMYHCRTENPLLPGLVIWSRPVSVEEVVTEIVVNTTGDEALLDPPPPDGACDVDPSTDGSQCTLRAAIQLVNDANSGKTGQAATRITFDIQDGVPVIFLKASLDPIVQPVEIDGTTQAEGFVSLDGRDSAPSNGLELANEGSVVAGLSIANFTNGIVLSDGGNHFIDNCVITENTVSGIMISDSHDNTITRSVLSSNGLSGVHIVGFQATDNLIIENKIGTDVLGETAQPNLYGVLVDLGSKNFILQNHISGNVSHGVFIRGPEATGNDISENYIGTTIDGTAPLGNGGDGILIEEADATVISENLISSNGRLGIGIEKGADHLMVGNLIGGPELGLEALGNTLFGVAVTESPNTTLRGNLVSANKKGGIALGNADGYQVISNTIGTDFERTEPLGNKGTGLIIENASKVLVEGNFISSNEGAGLTLFEGEDNQVVGNILEGNDEDGIQLFSVWNALVFDNVVSSNEENGIVIIEGGENKVLANRIGTDDSGTDALGNRNDGIQVVNSYRALIAANLVSANGRNGVKVEGANTLNVSIVTNLIGGDINRRDAQGVMGNGENGIEISKAVDAKIVGNESSFNRFNGIVLIRTTRGLVALNKLTHNEWGIGLIGAKGARVKQNVITRNQQGILGQNASELLLACNDVFQNEGSATGIHLTASDATLWGNTIREDAGDAITLEEGSTATVTNNNIFTNEGFGLNNLSPSVMVAAQSNWWGDASGPGGTGPGTGDEVSTGVDYANWLTGMVAVVVSAESDEVLLPTGEADTVSVFVQNWQVRDDALNLTVSDTEGWLQSPASLTVTLDDSTGAEARLAFAVPAGTANGATSIVEVTATSQADNSHTANTTFPLIAQSAALAQVLVLPDVVEVAAGDTVQFDALGLDQFNRTVAITPVWSATGGAIDSNGVYVAGATTGEFEVTATDPATGLSGTARVGNGVPVATEEAEDVPTAFRLDQNYPNPFNPMTTIPYVLPTPERVRLVVYDLLGRQVAVLVNAMQPTGTHQVQFDASRLPSSVYFYRLTAGRFSLTRKMILLK